MNKTIGWHFPVTFNKYSQSIETTTGKQSIKEQNATFDKDEIEQQEESIESLKDRESK